jgi:hypothetical protein
VRNNQTYPDLDPLFPYCRKEPWQIKSGGGVLAPIIWIYYEKYIKINFNMLEKFFLNWCVHLKTLCLHTSFKKNILSGMYKETKNVSWIVILQHRNLSFLHGTQTILVFHENLYANIESLDVHEKNPQCFDILKYVFNNGFIYNQQLNLISAKSPGNFSLKRIH